jgi:hypothetical protein
MKRFMPHILWFVAGAILGIAASTVLHELWFRLGWRQPVAEWLASQGQTALAGHWGLVWLHLPDCLVAAVVGICAGLIMKRQPVVPLLMFGIGFVVAPLVVSFVMGFDFTVFGPAVSARAIASSCGTIVVALLFGLLSHRWRWRSIEHETSAA